MKKVGLILVALLVGFGVLAQADTRTVSLSVTGGQAIAYSDAIPVSGILEKIEVVQTANVTNTIRIATYSGTTALDTYALLTSLATATKVVRPDFLPTDNTGTALAAVNGAATNTLQQLVVTYRQAILGGNIKLAVTTGSATGETASTVTATIYFRPLER
jgi:hypothetical protein